LSLSLKEAKTELK